MFLSQNLLHSRVFQAFNVSHCYHVFSKLGIGGQLLQGSNYLLTCFKQNAIYQLFDTPIIYYWLNSWIDNDDINELVLID